MNLVCQIHQISKRQYGKSERWRCHKCLSEQVKISRTKFVLLLKKEHGGQCSDCGYNKVMDILVFHHIDPATKSFSVGSVGGNHKKMREEAKKCELLCPNCHALRHIPSSPNGMATGS